MADKSLTEHEVRPSETLRSLAVKYNTTTANLAQINHITSNAFIFPGMKLKVPQVGETISQMVAGDGQGQGQTEHGSGASSSRRSSGPTHRPSLSDMLGLSFETSKLTTSEPRAVKQATAESSQAHTNEQLMTEKAGFIKLQCSLLPEGIEGTLIVTESALMFEPVDGNRHKNLSSITVVEEISWLECVRVPK